MIMHVMIRHERERERCAMVIYEGVRHVPASHEQVLYIRRVDMVRHVRAMHEVVRHAMIRYVRLMHVMVWCLRVKHVREMHVWAEMSEGQSIMGHVT
jgi:hypothetical protein